MQEPDSFHRYAEHGAGHALPATVHPTINTPAAPAIPTESLVVDGVKLAVSDRLVALAAIRDQHRATMRGTGDRRHALLERADDLVRRVRLIDQHKYSGAMSPTALAEKAQLEADLEQVRAAQRTIDAEGEAATAAFGDAQNLLRAALRFAREAGAVIPVTLQGEAN